MGVPKHDLRGPDGRTLAELAMACAQAVASRVIVSGDDRILPGLDHVADQRIDAGPLGGIEAVLESGRDERYLFIPCDMPRLVPQILHKLATGLDDAEAVTFAQAGDEVRPVLPLALKASTRTTLRQIIERGDHSIHALLAALDAHAVPLEARDRMMLVNINTPEDWSDYLQ